MKTLGGLGRCHCNVLIFCCTSSPTEELEAEFSYCYLPNFLISDQLNRKFHIEIRLVDNFKLLKIDSLINSLINSFKCTHARMSVCLYFLLIRNISKFGIFPKMPQCYPQNGTISVMRGGEDIIQRLKGKERSSTISISSRDLRIDQNFPRENLTLKNRELFA